MLHAARAKTSLFYFEIDHALRAFGSFSYHNSLANYLMMTLALGIGLLLAGVEGGMAPMRGWRQRTAALLSFVLSPAMRLRLILVLMVIALVLTKSRMGNVALLLAIVALGVPLLYRAGRLSRRGLWLLLSIVAAIAAAGASGVAGGSLLLIPMATSLFGIDNATAMQVVSIGFIIGVVQDSAETALNSSTDVLFTAAGSYKPGDPYPRKLPLDEVPV